METRCCLYKFPVATDPYEVIICGNGQMATDLANNIDINRCRRRSEQDLSPSEPCDKSVNFDNRSDVESSLEFLNHFEFSFGVLMLPRTIVDARPAQAFKWEIFTFFYDNVEDVWQSQNYDNQARILTYEKQHHDYWLRSYA